MSLLTQSSAWKALEHHARSTALDLRELFAQDAGRSARMSTGFGRLFLDYSKQRANPETMALLFGLARQAGVEQWRDRMFAGEPINASEQRAVLHVALRSNEEHFPERADVMPLVRDARRRVHDFVATAHRGLLTGSTGKPIRDVVNLGIGGSDLGPRMVAQALRRHTSNRIRVHFAANIDPAELDAVLGPLDPETTLFIVVSKTFTTQETLDNARRAQQWLERKCTSAQAVARHFIAVTANIAKASERGIPEDRVFPFWDWVGGRYSVWSAVGLAAALAVGNDAYDGLLEGARQMDEHFRAAPLESNLPVILALVSLWNVNFLGARSHAVLPYSDELKDFPAYLQQLEMESNGKRVDRDGHPIDYETAPVIWGSTGTVSQHSFHQLLHQGTPLVPVDFIVPARGPGDPESHALLVANALAQGSALMMGTPAGEPEHAVCLGNRPSSTLLLDQISANALGQLIALYEHKVFVQGVLWNINSFDQWGVELGKKIARSLAEAKSPTVDASTAALLERVRSAP